MDQDLHPFEDFIGFYELENTKSDTIVCVFKGILTRIHLILDDCKVQTYSGTSNMMGKISKISTQIIKIQPKAVAVRCQGHSLSLSVKSLNDDCEILRDTVGHPCRSLCISKIFTKTREFA